MLETVSLPACVPDDTLEGLPSVSQQLNQIQLILFIAVTSLYWS